METGRIFISYRRTDRGDLVERLYDRLDAHFGRGRVFIDVDGIPAGVDFLGHIEKILAQCGVVVAVMGPRWADELRNRAQAAADSREPDFVRVELERALALKKSVFPVLLGDARMPSAADLPDSLAPMARLQATHLRSGPDFRTDAERLIDALEGIVGAGSTAPTRPAPEEPHRRLRLAVSAADIQEDSSHLIGARIGQYVVRRIIGTGGSGVAMAATHVSLAHQVCVKLSFPLGDRTDTLMGAIRRGMRGLVQLQHPGIARIHDFDEVQLDDGWCFFVVMELVDGIPLDRWASGLPDDGTRPDREIEAARQIAEALVVAHACKYTDDAGFQLTGVMHGDIKPSNVIVRRNGVPVLVDFMLVDVQQHLQLMKARTADDNITAAFGTPGFMAPEQVKQGIVTTASDIFGLGCTLLTVFRGTVSSDPNLERLTQQMVADDPRDRPESMAAVAQALAAVRSKRGDPGQAAPKGRQGLVERLRRFFR